MSLDLRLLVPRVVIKEKTNAHPLTLSEWNAKHPEAPIAKIVIDSQEAISGDEQESAYSEVFSANITHNLYQMACYCGLDCLWDDDHLDMHPAAEFLPAVREGLQKLHHDPEGCRAQEISDWGQYDHFLPWIEKLLEAMEAHPDALVNISC